MSVCKRKKRKTDYAAIEENERRCNEKRKQHWTKYLKNSIFGGGMGGQFFVSVDGVQIPLETVQSLDDVDLGDIPGTVDQLPETNISGNVSIEFSVPVTDTDYFARIGLGQGHCGANGKGSVKSTDFRRYFSDPIIKKMELSELEDMSY